MQSIVELCDAIETLLGAAIGITRSQSYNELGEQLAPADLPLLQVYPQGGSCDLYGKTDRTSWGGFRQEGVTIRVDLYASQRSMIKQDMARTTQMTDAIRTVLRSIGDPPFFGAGSEGVAAFHWTWTRRVFVYSGLRYMGARFIITMNVK